MKDNGGVKKKKNKTSSIKKKAPYINPPAWKKLISHEDALCSQARSESCIKLPSICGKSSMDIAKIIGITPAWFIFKGR